ncbi:peptidoglycan editing factor PgeF [Natronospora cellulosivora (SeqCode)]
MFSWIENNGVQYLRIEEFCNLGVKAYFTSRLGGVSCGNYSSLNLGLHTQDNKEDVLENRKKIANATGINSSDFVAAEQVHGNNVYIVGDKDKGAGARNYKTCIPGVDALITARKGIPLISFYADCVPLFFLEPEKNIIALAHAGWKGTVSKIALKTINEMQNTFNINCEKLWVGIGPSISRDNYLVNDVVIDKLKREFPKWQDFVVYKGSDQYLLDLWQVNISILEEVGVLSKQIILSEYCTYKNNDLFYSYRKENGRTGRMASIIFI